MAVVGVAVVFYLVGLVIRASRIVHRHDESAVDGASHHFLIERLGGVLLGRADSLAALRLKGIGELLRRFADSQRDHLVDLGEHPDLGLVDAGLLAVLLGHIAELKTILAEFRSNQRAHLRGIVAAETLRHHLGRHQSVLLGQVADATEGATVANGTLEEELHARVVDGLLARIHTSLQHEIGLLQLIPDKEISLRELQLNGVAVLTGVIGTQHIEPAEHPAAS